MLNFIPVIIALVIAVSYKPGMFPGPDDRLLAITACAAFCFGTYLLSALLSHLTLSRIRRPGARERFLPRLPVLRRVFWALVLGNYCLLVHFFNWPRVLPEWAGAVPLADEVFSIAPFFAAVFFASFPMHRIERALRSVTSTRWEYIRYQFRQYTLPVVPYLAFSFAGDLLGHSMELERLVAVYPSLAEAASAVFFALIFVFAPLFIRFLWPATELQPGELRTRLEALTFRAGVKTRRIYVWHTGGGRMINACITGAASFLRYSFITDGLMDKLSTNEIESVFAHETAHARHHHLLVYLVLLLTFMFVLSLASGPIDAAASRTAETLEISRDVVAVVFILVLLVVFCYFIFGALSRALEKHADLAGVLILGNLPAFVSALEKLAFFAGGIRKVKGWRYPSVAHRVDFLVRTRLDPRVGVRFLVRLNAALAVLLLFFTAGAAYVAVGAGLDLAQTRAGIVEREARYYFNIDRPEMLEKTLQSTALTADARMAAVLANAYGEAYLEQGRDKLAKRLYVLAEDLVNFRPDG